MTEMKKSYFKLFAIYVVILLSVANLKAQSFEGKLVYSVQYISKNLANGIVTDTTILYVKGNKVKTTRTINPSAEAYLLNGIFYDVIIAAEKILQDTSSLTVGEILTQRASLLSERKNKKKILGFKCKQYSMIQKTRSGFDNYITFWITDKWDVVNSDMYMFKDIGVVVKQIENAKNVTIIHKLIKINETKLNDSIFQLPDYPIIKTDMRRVTEQLIKSSDK